jgi:hypothetical protein
MIAVSAEFSTAVKSSPRRWVPRLQIVWTDPFIDPTISVTDSQRNYTSYKEQVADLKTLPAYKWFHLDGICKFDGQTHIAPGADTKDQFQMGWWGSNPCNASAEWAAGSYPDITVAFAVRPVQSLVVVGDSQYGEYPVDFDIQIRDTGLNLLYTEAVTGNTLLSWSANIADEGINDACYMTLIIKKWSHPSRVVKILEFYTSIVEVYEGDEIVSMNLLEEREIADGALPVGNISANELDISLQNIKIGGIPDPFSYENTASHLKNLLKNNRTITAWIGLVLPDDTVEWILLGTFWSGDWQTSERSAVVTTSARDRMEKLRKAEYTTSVLQTNVSLYDLAETVLTDALTKFPDLTWLIDTELQSYIIPFGYFPRQDYFKCIRQIVEACRGQAYMSREDVLTITGPSFAGNT